MAREIIMLSHNTTSPQKNITILGIGNTLYQDEGMGVHILPTLREVFEGQEDVEIIEGATDGMILLGPVESTDYLIVIDAIHAGIRAGEIITLVNDEIPNYFGVKVSIHQIGFQEVLAAAKLRDQLPKHLFMCGIQPHSMELGLEVSDVIKETFPALVDTIVNKVSEWRNLP